MNPDAVLRFWFGDPAAPNYRQPRALWFARGPAADEAIRSAFGADRDFAPTERYGRFPHRNAVLGRSSTPEEVAFLTQPGSSF